MRFHHQALPQEYLDHYEASQSQLICKGFDIDTAKDKVKDYDEVDHMQEQKINDSVQMWLQKVTEIHDDKVAEEREANRNKIDGLANVTAVKKPSRVVSYNDLPYMGEMTLENSKPRRGRKPKKADICHLIYKNYGTIFPDQPMRTLEMNDEESTSDTRKTNVQSNLISSLLEKRLTQKEIKSNKNYNKTNRKSEKKTLLKSEEPLNLCIRDISDKDIQIISSENTDDYLIDSKPEIPALILPNNPLFSSSLKMALPNFQSAMLDTKTALDNATVDISDSLASSNNWLSSNAFMHPMALYLHKIADSTPTESSSASPQKDTPKKTAYKNVLVPKKISELVEEDSSMATATPSSTNACDTFTPISNNVSVSSSPATIAPKRKRSAIFIPPVPEESSTNHATEVSICKFKFTGGAKPSLQEKKMLSVDAGGNFRYYSGTGDKSIRGYEFFPRESLQQSSLMNCSSAGAFLNTPGKKITADMLPSSHELNNKMLQLPLDIITTPVLHSNNLTSNNPLLGAVNNQNRKRKSKRSIQREKLEKTFKEKGFLIQTQQLQSAEGATYCKFRQLRKFTRYLFRSWKDYLPGELQQSPVVPGIIDDNNMHVEPQPNTSTYLPSLSNTQQKRI